MTVKQRILKAFYPVFVGFTKLAGKNLQVLKNDRRIRAVQPFFELSVILNNGSSVSMSTFKGKKLLLVNTASNCGYTAQYNELQRLYQEHADKLVVIGFPANDFNEQEKGNDEEIAQFCKLNYGVTFPLSKKSSVVKSGEQNEVFRWLTDRKKNGWNDQQPVWNFSKYLINEEGVLTGYFAPSVSPLSIEVIEAVNA